MSKSLDSWICDGVPKDGKTDPSVSKPHAPYKNFSEDCTICGLPKSAAIPPKKTVQRDTSNLKPIAATLAIVTLGLGLGYGFLKSKDCLPNQQKVNGVCTAASSNAATASIANDVTIYNRLQDVPKVPSGLFSYGGSTTFAPLREPKRETELLEAHPEFRLRYTEPPSRQKPGSGTGIKMLLEGQLSFSQSSRPLKTKEFEEADKRGFSLEQIAIGIDGIAIYVHPDLADRISGLTVAQVREIFSGKITNWEEVGGPDLQVVVFSRNPKAGGTPVYFLESVLGDADFSANYQEVRDTTESVRQVGGTPGALGYATASEAIGQSSIALLPLGKEEGQPFVSPCQDSTCNAVNIPAFADGSYPITRRLFVVLKLDGSLDEQAGRAYVNLLLSDDGQKLVQDVGFVPLRSP